MKKLTLLFLFITFSSQLFAQSFYNRRVDRQWIASFGTGTAKYFGDMANPGEVFKNAKWNIEFGLERRIDRRFSARAAFTVFQLKGGDEFADDESRKRRNLSFTSTNFEFSGTGTVQLFEDGSRYYQRKPINAFLSAGIGVLWYIPKGLSTNTYHDGSSNPSAGKMVALRKLQTEGRNYSPVTIVVPIGGGAKLMATPFLNITVSGAYRFAFTDYLDDVSTVYPDVTSFQDPLAAAMSNKRFEVDGRVYDEGVQRGNPENNDGYFILSIRADYFLPPTLFGTKRRSPKGSRYKKPKRR
jgi:hypothetical protein